MELSQAEYYATHNFTMPTIGVNPKPGDVDAWVPGSQDAVMSCSQAIGSIQEPYFQNFAYNTDQPFSSLCQPNTGLGGGCQSLTVERAQTWERVLKPQLKEQLERHHNKQKLLPTGSVDGQPATAICSVRGNAIDQCTGVTGPSCFVPPNYNSWMKSDWKNLN